MDLDAIHYEEPAPRVLFRKAQLRRLQGREEEARGLLGEACRLLSMLGGKTEAATPAPRPCAQSGPKVGRRDLVR